MRWDPNKKPPGGNLFLLIGSWTHCFTILFSYWLSITTIKNPPVPNQKKTEVPHQSCFLFGEVLAIGKRDYLHVVARGRAQTAAETRAAIFQSCSNRAIRFVWMQLPRVDHLPTVWMWLSPCKVMRSKTICTRLDLSQLSWIAAALAQ